MWMEMEPTGSASTGWHGVSGSQSRKRETSSGEGQRWSQRRQGLGHWRVWKVC